MDTLLHQLFLVPAASRPALLGLLRLLGCHRFTVYAPLYEQWRAELRTMARRVQRMRQMLADELRAVGIEPMRAMRGRVGRTPRFKKEMRAAMAARHIVRCVILA